MSEDRLSLGSADPDRGDPAAVDDELPTVVDPADEHGVEAVDSPRVPDDVAARQPKGVVPSGLTPEVFNVQSGRMAIRGMPTKPVQEALAHMREITVISLNLRAANAAAAQRAQEARQHEEVAEHVWITELLPEWEALKHTARVRELCNLGIPPSVRPIVWRTAIGNRRGVSVTLYDRLVRTVEEREKTAAAEQQEPGEGDTRAHEADDNPHDERIGDDASDGTPEVLSEAAEQQDSGTPEGRMSDRQATQMITASDFPTTSAVLPENASRNTRMAQAARKAATAQSQIDVDVPRTHILLASPTGSPAPQSRSTTPAAYSGEDASATPPPTAVGTGQTGDHDQHPLAGDREAAVARAATLLLRAFVEYQPTTGYVQGMSYVAAMLLFELPPFEAFSCFVNIVSSGHIPFFYNVNHRAMSAYLSVFQQGLEQADSTLASALRVAGATAELFCPDWYMTIFARSLPLPLAQRCWDMYIGEPVMVHRIAIALVVSLRHRLLEDPEEALVVLTTLHRHPERVNVDKVIALATSTKGSMPSVNWLRQIERVQTQPWRAEGTIRGTTL